jgi:Domain of unknown function (DUF1707)
VADDLWSSFPHDPRDKRNTSLRASDEDRERIVATLASAYAEGRIDQDELEERTDAAAGARLLGDLPPLVADLVPDQPLRPAASRSLVGVSHADLQARALEEWRDKRRSAVFAFLGSSLFFWGIWAWTFAARDDGVPFPWPIFVTLLAGMNAVRVMADRERIVRDEVARLEKKQARQQRWPKGLP